MLDSQLVHMNYSLWFRSMSSIAFSIPYNVIYWQSSQPPHPLFSSLCSPLLSSCLVSSLAYCSTQVNIIPLRCFQAHRKNTFDFGVHWSMQLLMLLLLQRRQKVCPDIILLLPLLFCHYKLIYWFISQYPEWWSKCNSRSSKWPLSHGLKLLLRTCCHLFGQALSRDGRIKG